MPTQTFIIICVISLRKIPSWKDTHLFTYQPAVHNAGQAVLQLLRVLRSRLDERLDVFK